MAVAGFVDTAFIALLLRFFLSLSGETSSQVFIGRRPVKRELLLGLAFMPVVFLGVAGVVLALRAIAPSLHNVQVSPLEPYVTTPFDAAIFFVVVVLVGGVREELQRAFILHRFRQRLGGANLGLTLFSVLFAALHYDQGIDVAIAVGLLGLLWGVLYLKRGSAMLPMANHASFNAVQVVQGVIARTVGS
jgi:membrane protease YdiL (CAAX protease family)